MAQVLTKCCRDRPSILGTRAEVWSHPLHQILHIAPNFKRIDTEIDLIIGPADFLENLTEATTRVLSGDCLTDMGPLRANIWATVNRWVRDARQGVGERWHPELSEITTRNAGVSEKPYDANRLTASPEVCEPPVVSRTSLYRHLQ